MSEPIPLSIEISQWASQYRGFLSSIVRADPALEYDDLINDLYVMFLEKNSLSIKEIAQKYHMRKLGFNWVPEQPNSNWSDWERGGEEAADVVIDDESVIKMDLPIGILVNSTQIANKLHLTRRRGQQIKKKQTAIIAAQVKGLPDEYGQFGLFEDGAMSITGNDYAISL